MCKVKNGHDYSEDAKREMGAGMNNGGVAWFGGMGQWLKSNWQILIVAAAVVGWIVRVEVFAQAGGRFTNQEAVELEQRWEERFDALPPDTYEKYIDQRFDSLELKLQEQHEDIIWIRNWLDK